MSTKILLLAGALATLMACAPAVPDSAVGFGIPDPGRGVGFENSLEDQRRREAALAAARSSAAQNVILPAQPPVQSAALLPSDPPQTVSSGNSAALASGNRDPELVAIEARADAAAQAANSGRAVVNADPSNPAPQIVNNPGISNENNFDAVSSQRSIAGDAARIAANRAQYQVVQPTALPDRSAADNTNVVAYALQTSHPRGTRVWRRVGLNLAAKSQRACAGYTSADQAQIDFLSRGGPQRDRLNLDPDGDGYACNWDPTPFRRAAGG